jgi:pyocin large subunit-like protein
MREIQQFPHLLYISFNTNIVDALKNDPPTSRATVATTTMLEFFEVSTSTLILAKPAGGGIHLEP